MRPSHIRKSNAVFQGEKEELHTSACCFLADNDVAFSVGFALVSLLLVKFLKSNL